VTTPGAVVWFKRDLRCRDHAPLVQAQHFDNAAALVVVEPAWLESPECDPRHVAFWLDSVAQLQAALAAKGLPLIVRVGAMPQMLQALRREFAFTHLFSHEETGPGWSYTRDLAVAAWCRDQGVVWTESPQSGVVRRLRSRSGWAARWAQRMNAPECTSKAASRRRQACGRPCCPRCQRCQRCMLWACQSRRSPSRPVVNTLPRRCCKASCPAVAATTAARCQAR